MPAPLLWLGAAALGIYASDRANTEYMKRKQIVTSMPGEGTFAVTPENGAVVCCGVYGVLDHTGIWVDGNIYELNGNGLVRCISPARFIENRSGEAIFVACDKRANVIANPVAAQRAQSQLYQLYDCHLFKQNCHRFVAEQILGTSADITSFSALNGILHEHYAKTIAWNPLLMNE
ncbi:hypothetical protein [Agaribacter flavus]|uniref:LRAT domain-containing protein n=1 Tax=Agaribacter flavus TaxID=1902781 RepID=A0ABV7FTL6_9ALTE